MSDLLPLGGKLWDYRSVLRYNCQTMTPRRRANLVTSFNAIAWGQEQLIRLGLVGDRPQYRIEGTIVGFPEARVVYRTRSPGGGNSSLRLFMWDTEVRTWTPAPQRDARRIQDQLYASLIYWQMNPPATREFTITQRRIEPVKED